jgi:cbb3-type cytochrome oxidase subunit 3
MEINTLRIAVTVAGLIVFLALVFWVYSKDNRAHFRDAGNLPFLDDQAKATQSDAERKP